MQIKGIYVQVKGNIFVDNYFVNFGQYVKVVFNGKGFREVGIVWEKVKIQVRCMMENVLGDKIENGREFIIRQDSQMVY